MISVDWAHSKFRDSDGPQPDSLTINPQPLVFVLLSFSLGVGPNRA